MRPAYLRGPHATLCIIWWEKEPGAEDRRPIFSADILTCSSRKSTGVINTINNVASVNLGEFQGRIVISNTCAFPATSRQNTCLKIPLAVKKNVHYILTTACLRGPAHPHLCHFGWLDLCSGRSTAQLCREIWDDQTQRSSKPEMSDEELSDSVWSQPDV